MVTVDIRGKEFPLCLTVAAVDKINAKCGSIKQIGTFLDGKEGGGAFEFGRAMHNTAWLLGLLIQEGEENRLVNARLNMNRCHARLSRTDVEAQVAEALLQTACDFP